MCRRTGVVPLARPLVSDRAASVCVMNVSTVRDNGQESKGDDDDG